MKTRGSSGTSSSPSKTRISQRGNPNAHRSSTHSPLSRRTLLEAIEFFLSRLQARLRSTAQKTRSSSCSTPSCSLPNRELVPLVETQSQFYKADGILGATETMMLGQE